MQGLNDYSIVLRGDSFPVDQVDLEDFEFLGRPVQEDLRLPPILSARAGEFRLQIAADRFQMYANADRLTDDRLGALKKTARTYVSDYAGRKSVRAVGHNMTGSVRTELAVVEKLRNGLIHMEQLSALVGGEAPLGADLVIGYRRGRESRSTLRLEFKSDEPEVAVAYVFNSHFQVSDPALGLDALGAIDALDESFANAEAILQSIMSDRVFGGGSKVTESRFPGTLQEVASDAATEDYRSARSDGGSFPAPHLFLVSAQPNTDTSTASYDSLVHFLIGSLMATIDETTERYARIRSVLSNPIAAAALQGHTEQDLYSPTPSPQSIPEGWFATLAEIVSIEHPGLLSEWYSEDE